MTERCARLGCVFFALFLFSLLILGVSASTAQDSQHFELRRNFPTNRVSSGTRLVNRGGVKTRVGFVRGDVEFVLTGIHGINRPRIIVEAETKQFIEVEYSYGSECSAFANVVNALELEQNVEKREVNGWALNSSSDRAAESTKDWPKDLFAGRKLNNGDTYSYLVTEFKGGGSIYRKNDVIYVKDVGMEDLASFIERSTRKIVAVPKDALLKHSFSFDVADLRGWQNENRIEIGSHLMLDRSRVEVPILVVTNKNKVSGAKK